MAEEKKQGLCVSCRREPPFQRELDKCWVCALKYRDELWEKLTSNLTPAQCIILEKYQKAEEDCYGGGLLFISESGIDNVSCASSLSKR